jgi:hypothetical protein
MERALRSTLALFALLLACGSAHATAFCEIRATRDGFVMLRAAPSAAGKPLARMAPGDEVMLLPERRRGWARVRWWRGDERLSRGFQHARGEGWVRATLLDVCG